MAETTSERLDTPVGETTTKSIQISSADGTSFPAEVYTGVNVTDDPDLREPLVEGTLNEVGSPLDGDDRTYTPAVPVTYHDEQLELFVLVIPEALRHEEFACRAALLQRLSSTRQVVPAYMRRFEVVFDPAELEGLEKEYDADQTADPAESTDDEPSSIRQRLQSGSDGDGEEIEELRERIEELEDELQKQRRLRREAQEAAESEETGQNEELDKRAEELEQRADELDERAEELEQRAGELDERAEELEQRAGELDGRADELNTRDQQLQEVADRVERDSARVDEARQQLEQERAELERLRNQLDDQKRKLQVRELNLEQQELRRQQEGDDADAPKESTQIVTDDQFIEVVDNEETDDEVVEPADAGQPVGPPDSTRPEPAQPTMMTYDPDEFFEEFDEVADGDDWFVEPTDDLVVVGYSLDDDRAEAFLEGEPAFLCQLHDVDGVPVIALTLAIFDDDGDCLEAVAAPLTDQTDGERDILDALARQLHVHLAIYGDDGGRITAWEAGAPIRSNIEWARNKIHTWCDDNDDASDELAAAVEAFADGDVELVGSMRHPFDSRSFVDFDGASDVKFAAGIINYWSDDEQFEYLIGNRCYPLESFRRIQERVVRRALHWGIVPGANLREIAVEQSIVPDETTLVERLLSNFAEVCVGLRPNNLDPIEQWENWDTLIAMAEDHDITPDADMLELAEVSFKRAEEYEEVIDEEDDELPVISSQIDVTDSTISQRSEGSGVTYFLPEGRDGGAFDKLMDADRGDVEDALADEHLRVEAAQALLERFNADTVALVLEAVEEMYEDEVASLARFVEARADGLEAALMRELDSTGPQGTFIAARALAAIESTAAIPRLLDAIGDTDRCGDDGRLGDCLALFGDKLVPPLSQKLKDSPDDDELLEVLAALEQVREGTIEELAGEQSESLKKAAGRARDLV